MRAVDEALGERMIRTAWTSAAMNGAASAGKLKRLGDYLPKRRDDEPDFDETGGPDDFNMDDM